jgi:hypothetical protein
MTGGKRDAAYWRHRVERDYPDIARRLASGEISSVRAAAIEAGLLHEPSRLEHLRRAWKKATAEERSHFIEEIPRSAWPVVQSALLIREHSRKLFRGRPVNQGELFREEAAEAGADSGPPAMNENVMPLRDGSASHSAAHGFSRHSALHAEGHPTGAKEGRGAREESPLQEAQRLAASASALTEAATAGPSLRYGNGRQDYEAEHAQGDAGRHSTLGSSRPMPDSMHEGDDEAPMQRTASALPAHRDLPEALDQGRLQVGQQVAVGQQYVKLDAGPDPWEVLSIFAGPSDVPHARIVRLAEPDTVRVVSVGTLTNRRRYRPI